LAKSCGISRIAMAYDHARRALFGCPNHSFLLY
jgi:hypothetical protein